MRREKSVYINMNSKCPSKEERSFRRLKKMNSAGGWGEKEEKVKKLSGRDCV
jgi:hypothetical protein